MTLETIHAATYGEFWPNGVGYTSNTLPYWLNNDLLHFRVSSDGRVIGKAHVGGDAEYWTGEKWLSLGPSDGNNIGAFHPTNGTVYVSTAAGVRVYTAAGDWLHTIPGYIGSNGIRWINEDGSVVSGDSTYGIKDLIGEYTRIPDGLIGQGIAGGLEAVFDNQRRHVCDGAPQFLRVNVDGDAVMCYWTDFRNGYRLRTSLSELRALPVVIASEQPPIVEQPPAPQPQPEPTMEGLTDAQFATLERERAKYPSPDAIEKKEAPPLTGEEIGKILNATCWAHRDELGMQGKPGNSTVQPGTHKPIWNGIWIKRDGKDWGQDVLGAATVGIARAVRGEIYVGQPTMFEFVPPVQPADVVTPQPVPVPAPAPATAPDPNPWTPAANPGAVIDGQVAALSSLVNSLSNLVLALERKVAVLGAKLQGQDDKIANLPASQGVGPSLDGARISLKASNGRFLCADFDKGSDGPVMANRNGTGDWETFTVVRK